MKTLAIIALAAVLALFAAASIVPKAIGAVPLTVLTGSMQPALLPGDVAVMEPIAGASAELRVGDIVSFRPESGSDKLITHRIVGLGTTSDGGRVITTRGDANNAADKPLTGGQVVGRMLYSVPKVGYAANALGGSVRSKLAVAAGVGLLAVAALRLATAAGLRQHPTRTR